jgi:phosphoribosyl 1,2-cyclic phosphate phosphodiesterase
LGFAEFRTRMQVLIDDQILIDFPPEAYAHSLRFQVDLSNIPYLLVTHSHMDHFYAHDFILRGYKYATHMNSDVLAIFGNEEVGRVFAECTAREMKPVVAPHVSMTTVKPLQTFAVGDYRVMTIPAQHSKTEEALLYYVERAGKGYLHLCDTGRFPEVGIAYLKEHGANADLVTFDCTFAHEEGGEVSRHMGIQDNMLMKQKLVEAGICGKNTRYVITHFSHNGNPTRENLKDLERDFGVTAAYDGMQVEV